ncbi:hypothetical protein [Sphingomonas hankyongi]|uniref:EF-hand domain-containing protein n=1 Tax=Sphingomonas hankyongi TaxID=2908209 RepID=A0ABT0S079_9SPHN|nr:hypothetical protein [Sphingomonas hankyongi]MCL6729257.1 hypothetical protein [Sphingomonas hankyongi]
MTRLLVLTCLLTAASAAAAQTMTRASAPNFSRSAELFERDWVLMNWALKFYDRDRDILLSPSEAQAAAAEFRKIADADSDGRVTPQEYRAAREFILARY